MLRTKAECRTCEEPIFWARTEKGANMPVDWEPVESGNVVQVEDPSRVVVHVLAGDEVPDPGTERFTSHFMTCGDADVWRNR